MSTGAIIMFAFGATLLWGGLILAIAHYVRAARRDQE